MKSLLLVMLTIAVPVYLDAQPKRSRSWTWEPSTVVKRDHFGVVQIDFWDYVAGWKGPIGELNQAVNHYPKADRFRVNWNNANIGSSSFSGTALYIRSKNMVKVFGQVSNWESKTLTKRNIHYFGVNDALLKKLVDRVQQTDGGNDLGNFSLLADLGTRVVVIHKKTVNTL